MSERESGGGDREIERERVRVGEQERETNSQTNAEANERTVCMYLTCCVYTCEAYPASTVMLCVYI